MPWRIDTAHPDCGGYAVVKEDDGTLEGCHRTRREALAQLAALNIAEAERATSPATASGEPEDSSHRGGTFPDTLERQDGYTPTDGMVAEARRGLDWRQTYGRGGTEVGVARARDIVNRRRLSRTTVARMVSYFARHEVDKDAQGFRPGEPGYPSAGRIAWALWGGDAGRSWANAIIAESRSLQDDTPLR
jgi:hypothetical protein